MVIQSTQGAVTVLGVEGSLDKDLGEELLSRVSTLPRFGRTRLVIDLSSCPLIDSAGCEALLDLSDAVAERDGIAQLACPTPLCADTLLATGVSDSFDLHPTVREAVLNLAK